MQSIIYTKNEVSVVAEQLSHLMQKYAIYTFTGSLGAGKTTLIRELLQKIGVCEQVTSPTFTYMQIYTTINGITVYHFDLYRVDNLSSFMQAGFDEYLYQPKSIIMIEWPECIMPLLTTNVCHIFIDYNDDSSRILSYQCVPQSEKNV